jgi:predicted house-cleaning noncanonical NTP pyrophosphatase (MazG superfamily)
MKPQSHIEYNKLIRDHIPAIIRRNGLQCDITTMNEEEFRQALLAKLQEEAQEVAEADQDELITELADLYEVIDTIIATYHIDPEAVRNIQMRRRQERGGFSQRICLLRTYPRYDEQRDLTEE